MVVVAKTAEGRGSGVAALIVGVVMIAICAYCGSNTASFVSHATQALGVVVKLNAGPSHPEVEFTDKNGQRVSYPQGGFVSARRPGDSVRVLYLPDDPAGSATVDDFGALWFATLITGGLGSLFIAIGVVTVRKSPNKAKAVEA